MENADLAQVFEEIADVLELQGANAFRIRSYRAAAQTLRGLSEHVSQFRDRGELERLPHVGKGIAEKIGELLDTGRCKAHQELMRSPEAKLIPLMRIPGVGPRHAKQFYDALGITTIDELEAAARSAKLRDLPGMGERSERKILGGIQQVRESLGRFRLADALAYAERLTEVLQEVPGVDRTSVAGSLRRCRETVGDIDILVTCRRPGPVMDAFTGHGSVKQVLARGETKSSVLLRNGLQADLRVVPDASYGAALHYFTGSKAHNIAVRQRGVRKGLKINEYGVFRQVRGGAASGRGRRVGGRTEEEVFAAVGLPWIPPELREDRGEIEAAEAGRLPALVELPDIRGDCQTHSTHSDGHNTIEEMARAAMELGYEYIVITDHSKRVTVANGLDERRLAAEWREIDRVNRKLDGIRVLKGVEVDILKDGRLDLEDDCLAKADVVVASVHYHRDLTKREMTDRILRALENPHVDILAHPTGRLLLEREPFAVDMEAVIEAARRHGVLLECNASPERLDLTDVHLRLAKEAGVPVVISTDAHSTQHLAFMRYGIFIARRGWIEAGDVANTRSLREFLSMLRG